MMGLIIYKKLMTCLSSVKEKISFQPETALIPGASPGDYTDGIQIEEIMEYTEIEGFPVSTVKGHKGRFIFGYIYKTPSEVKLARTWDKDAVRMNTACETIAARYMGLEVCGISCITNNERKQN